jgi:nitroreductase
MSDAIELLSTRTSFKAVELTAPGPSAAEIDKLLTIACRVPDHGKLRPWRFIVFEGDARVAAAVLLLQEHSAPNIRTQKLNMSSSSASVSRMRRWLSR